MKDIRPALRNLLLSDPAVSAMVGGSRIYSVVLDQAVVAPALVFHRVSGFTDYQMNGPSDLAQVLMQIDASSLTSDQSSQLADATHAKLSGFKGEVAYGSSPIELFIFRGIFSTNLRELYDSASKLYRVSRDFTMWYKET